MPTVSKRQINLLGFAICAGLLGFGYYLQFFQGLEPCPLCIFQRVAFISLGAILLIAGLHNPGRIGARLYGGLIALAGLAGTGISSWHVYIQNLPPEVVKDFAGEKDLQIFDVSSNGYTAIRYNCGRPIFKHKALRQALAHAIPHQRIIVEVLGGNAGTTPTGITPVNAFWHDASLQVRKFDPALARKILTDAGFRWNKEGRLCFPPE